MATEVLEVLSRLETGLKDTNSQLVALQARQNELQAQQNEGFLRFDKRFLHLEAELANVTARVANPEVTDQWSKIHPLTHKVRLSDGQTQYRFPPSCFPTRVRDFWGLEEDDLITLIKFYEAVPEAKIQDLKYRQLHEYLAQHLHLHYAFISTRMQLVEQEAERKNKVVRKSREQEPDDEDGEGAKPPLPPAMRHNPLNLPPIEGKSFKEIKAIHKAAGLLVSSSPENPTEKSYVDWDNNLPDRTQQKTPSISKTSTSSRSGARLSPTQRISIGEVKKAIR